MDVKKIETINNDGTISEVEVNSDVWQFDEVDRGKREYENRKFKDYASYDEICYLQEIGEIAKISNKLTDASAENEYIKNCERYKQKPLIKKLHKAINKLRKKQRRRIILKFSQDMTISRIAKIENCTERTIYLSISNAINFLNEVLNRKKD